MASNTTTEEILTLPILPIKNAVLFPHMVLTLSIGRKGSLAAVEAALGSEDKLIAVYAQKASATDSPGEEDLFPIGTKAVIRKHSRGKKEMQLVVQGIERVSLIRLMDREPYLRGRVRELPGPQDKGVEVDALHRSVLENAGKIQNLFELEGNTNITELLSQFRDPIDQAYLLSTLLNLDVAKEQSILEAPSTVEALRLIHRYLTHEIQVSELRRKIANEAVSEVNREQREYFLRQQLKAIQQELGEENPAKAEIQSLREKIESAGLPEDVRKEADRELARLEQLPAAAPDYQLMRSYLELVAELPWNRHTTDNLDLDHARKILDFDHFNMKEIKERILEQLAVMKLNPTAKSPILCFVGPPGVGKTSLGESIARALGRKFERMSLGGLHDEAELRGHRRTYIGAMPGRILQAMRRAGSSNPVLMLDELDKVGADFRGDPYAALLEILDPAQNHTFRDNYLNLPFDLSKVLFIATANRLDTIPAPLLDRMEVMELSGYSHEEKMEIAKRYLIPRRLKEAGLTEANLSIADESLRYIIRHYTREAGVRTLERTLGQIARKVAMKIATGSDSSVTVRINDLSDLLGTDRFYAEKARKDLPPGVATGLAWTESGGDVLYIEATRLPKGKNLILTGQLGKIMKESAEAALSYVWANAHRWHLPETDFSDSGVHIHVPAGAIPKDGPSAGITIATALASLYSRLPVRSDTGMTGEVTLTGLVLPIGGVKEKVLAAHRAGLRRIIFPKENEKDLRDIPEPVRKEMEFILAERLDQVLEAAIPGFGRLESFSATA